MNNDRNNDPATMRHPVEVITRDLANPDAPAARKVIDHDSHSDRIWLGKHAFWSVRNNHSVTTAPITK